MHCNLRSLLQAGEWGSVKKKNRLQSDANVLCPAMANTDAWGVCVTVLATKINADYREQVTYLESVRGSVKEQIHK